jgi:hypothetical protein
MSKLNTYTPNPNAIGRTKIINDIIVKMEASNTFTDSDANDVNWVERYYGLARINEVDGKRFPTILDYQGDDYQTLQPNDNYRSMAFFYDEGIGDYIESKTISYNFNMIVWYNKDLLDNSGHEILDNIIRSTQGVLNKCRATLNRVYINREDVFSQFSANYFDERFMHSPFNAFRINFTALDQCDNMSNGQKFISNIVVS